METKILITPRSFGKLDQPPFEKMNSLGIEYVLNEFNRVYTEEELIEKLPNYDGIIVGIDPITKKVIDQCPNLKTISKYGVGMDNIDVDYAREKGIVVTKTDGANTQAVADYVFASMLSIARQVKLIDSKTRKKDWSKNISLDIWNKKIGIIGFGAIGQAVAKRAQGFKMDIFYYDPFTSQETVNELGLNAKQSSLDTIVTKADFISVHAPLTKDTKDMITNKHFTKMKDTSIIINTARGGIVNEEALYQALLNKEIFGAALDVFENEPEGSYRFIDLDNVLLSSHTAASTNDAVNNMSIMALDNLIEAVKERL